MSRSHLFTLQERRSTVRLAQLAQSLRAAQTESLNSQHMGERLGALMAAMAISDGVVSVAELRDRARLTDRLGAEQQRQITAQHAAEAQAQGVLAAIQSQMIQAHTARDAAHAARRQEAEERAQKQDAARPAPRIAR
jgi:hypothetical protein